MTAVIYYFSATGNSLHVARKIGQRLGQCELIDMAGKPQEQAMGDEIDTMGFVFPVFYGDMPYIVRDFIRGIAIKPRTYLFAVATCGGSPVFTLFMLDKLLKKKGVQLNAGFSLTMPDNAYVYHDLVTPPEKREPILKASEGELSKIIEVVGQKGEHRVHGGNKLTNRVGMSLLLPLIDMIFIRAYRMPKRFRSDGKCTGCGVCVRVCPVGNVTMEDKKASWGNNCTQCLACFHWCPAQAVQQGKNSAGVARYHHPDVTAGDIISARTAGGSYDRGRQ